MEPAVRASGARVLLADALAARDQTLERIQQLTSVEPNWDAYGGLPPTPAALDQARQVVRQVAELYGPIAGARISPFAVAPISDGGVHLEWRASGVDLEVDIGPAGALGYLLVEGTGTDREFTERDNVSLSVILELVQRPVTASIEE